MIRANCQVHGGDNPTAFAMNTKTTLWFCHTGDCGGGDIFTLVQHMEEVSFQKSVTWLSNFYGIDINDMEISNKKRGYVKEMERFIASMEFMKKKDIDTYTPCGEFSNVTSFRGFERETLMNFNLMYAKHINLVTRAGKDYTLYHRLVFPIKFNNEQVGISIRRIKKKDEPKWLHQPVNFLTGNILYNYDEAKGKAEVVICEGITDVWSFYELGIPAICVFGSNITNEQYKFILKLGSDLVFAFDGDDAGRNAVKKALEMFKDKANMSVIYFKEGEDPESIPRQELLIKYEERRKY